MIQTEAERQFYLGVAGVRLWYARAPLPGAAPSPEFRFPEPPLDTAEGEPRVPPERTAEVGAAVTGASAGKSPSPSRAVNLQSLMESAAPKPPGGEAAPRSVQSESAPGSEAPASMSDRSSGGSEAVPFLKKLNLRLWLGGRFVLVSDLSGEASLRLQETLAENILKSMRDQNARELGPVLWPVFNNPLLPGNRLPDLVEVLKGVLAPLDDQQVILLGVASSGEEAADKHWFADVLGREPDLVFPHTLAELAGNPELKKQLWLRLKPLI